MATFEGLYFSFIALVIETDEARVLVLYKEFMYS